MGCIFVSAGHGGFEGTWRDSGAIASITGRSSLIAIVRTVFSS